MKLTIIVVALQAAFAAAADTTIKEDAVAKLRGVAVASDFLADLSCSAQSDCADNEFCKFNLANCGKQGDGLCTEVPGDTACPMNIDYVCGCNGKTYSNECVADSSGVSIKHFGECEIIDCNADDDCNDDEYCQFNVGNCGNQGLEGICVDVPVAQACPMNYAPVCGCNDQTYSNECAAQAKGLSIKYFGECDTVECFSNNDCSSSNPTDTACNSNYHPVCGCNGETYPNSCTLTSASQSIKYWGEC